MDLSKDQQIEMIGLSSKQAQEKVELAEALEVLEKNKHFKKVFKDYYLNKYALRLVELKAAPSMQDEVQQKFITNTLDAIGNLSQFMIFVHQEGTRAKDLIYQNEQELDNLELEYDEEA